MDATEWLYAIGMGVGAGLWWEIRRQIRRIARDEMREVLRRLEWLERAQSKCMDAGGIAPPPRPGAGGGADPDCCD